MMNGRIRKLIRDQDLEIGSYYWTDEEKERFAQRIIRECAQVCLAQRDPPNLNYKPSKQFAEAVKEHFGVE